MRRVVPGRPRWVPQLNDHRGAFLLLLGVLSGALGWSYVEPDPSASVLRTMAWLPHAWPLSWCGWTFIAAATVAVVSAFRPLPADRWGFAALSFVFGGWTIAHLWAWRFAHTAVRGYVSALIFAMIASAIMVVAGMLNPGGRDDDPRNIDGGPLL